MKKNNRFGAQHVSGILNGIILTTAALGSMSRGATVVLDSTALLHPGPALSTNLAAQSGIDWSAWGAAPGSPTALAPGDDKSTGTTIGDPRNAGTTNVSGKETSARGEGITLRVAGDRPTERGMTLDLGSSGATGTLHLALAGLGSPLIDAMQVFAATAPGSIAAYTLRFKSDLKGDLLTAKRQAPAVRNTTVAQAGTGAVTNAAVPEAGPIALGMVGMLVIFRRRR